jgi:hypothetical protein
MVVCIAGMHRSGTSMIARLLNLCGMCLGKENDIIVPGCDNPEGFWENIKFIKINDEILSFFGGGWDFPPLLKRGWEKTDEVIYLRLQAQEIIGEFHDVPIWGWKDPRNSITIPFWQNLIPDLKVIICLRNPLEVAASLERRGSATLNFSLNLWRIYNQSILDSVPSKKVLITHYNSFFINPVSELQRILDFIGITQETKVIQQACYSIKDSIRHNQLMVTDLIRRQISSDIIIQYVDMCLQSGDVLLDTDSKYPDYQELMNSLDPETSYKTLLFRSIENEQNLKIFMEKAQILSNQIREQDKKQQMLTTKVAEQEQELKEIKNSRTWKLASLFQKIRATLLPPESFRSRFLEGLSRPLFRGKK